jgi:hypothetical protein
MAARREVTKATAVRYAQSSRREKQVLLDELCRLTGWHRDNARKALRAALKPPRPRPARRPRPPVYDESVMAVLRKAWAVMDAPCGKLLAPMLPAMIDRLRACGELDIDDDLAARAGRVSAATIDRRFAADRARLAMRGRSGTKPGSLLKNQIPIRTWADWADDRPGFVEIDLVGHEGGDPSGDFCQTLTVTDIATGWTETRAVQNKAQKWVFAALQLIVTAMPFDVVGIDSDNGKEFINEQLLRYCEDNHITFTRSRVGNKNDGAHVEGKNWTVVRRAVGYHRYDTMTELAMLNDLYARLRLMTNFFIPQAKLIAKTRTGAKVTKKYDTAATPYQRVLARPDIDQQVKDRLTAQYQGLNPAALRREMNALNDQLLAIARAKRQHPKNDPIPALLKRAKPREATTQAKRAI